MRLGKRERAALREGDPARRAAYNSAKRQEHEVSSLPAWNFTTAAYLFQVHGKPCPQWEWKPRGKRTFSDVRLVGEEHIPNG
jgi:hypothetical protein